MYNPLKAETFDKIIAREQTSGPVCHGRPAVAFPMRLMVALDVSERRAAQGFAAGASRAAEAREQLRILQNITPEGQEAYEFFRYGWGKVVAALVDGAA